MAQAGVGNDVMLSYITNSSVRFGVNADQIVYLNDLGVSGSVVTAMMQHDASLNAAMPPTATPPPVTTMPDVTSPGTDFDYPTTQVADDNDDMTPPPDYGDYSQYPPDYSVPDDTDYFYDSLLPYGNWIYLTGYGLCWQPTVYMRDHSWRPYFDRGRWLYSDSGWYWQSDYTWGWAAFHYGRWFRDSGHGWVWHPDRVWGPSWVAWRQSGEYAGWAPLPPAAVFAPGIGFSFHHQAVTASFDFGLPGGLFAFIPVERFADYAPSRYVASGDQASRLFRESHVLAGMAVSNGHVQNQGLSPQLVDERAGEHIRRVVIQTTRGTDANGKVLPDRLARRGDSLVIYRPQLSAIPGHQPLGFQNAGSASSIPEWHSPNRRMQPRSFAKGCPRQCNPRRHNDLPPASLPGHARTTASSGEFNGGCRLLSPKFNGGDRTSERDPALLDFTAHSVILGFTRLYLYLSSGRGFGANLCGGAGLLSYRPGEPAQWTCRASPVRLQCARRIPAVLRQPAGQLREPELPFRIRE